jgi:hypothetical protein
MKWTSGFFLLALSLIATMVHAICPFPTPKVCASYFESDVVFVGKVLSKEYVSVPDLDNDTDWIQYTIKVEDVYRGHANAIENVRTPNTSIRWLGEEGKIYVFFLKGGKTYSTCGPLDKSEYVQEVARQIDALQNASTATIEGQVFSRSGPWGGGNGVSVEGVPLKVLGGSKEFLSITDKDGRFSILLPPGNYTLIAPGMELSDYSHGNLEKINLERGQCAQFELVKE